jgi:hypothetical protein
MVVATASQQLDRRSSSRLPIWVSSQIGSRYADSVEHHVARGRRKEAQTLAPSGLGNAGHVTTRRREHPGQGALPSHHPEEGR